MLGPRLAMGEAEFVPRVTKKDSPRERPPDARSQERSDSANIAGFEDLVAFYVRLGRPGKRNHKSGSLLRDMDSRFRTSREFPCWEKCTLVPLCVCFGEDDQPFTSPGLSGCSSGSTIASMIAGFGERKAEMIAGRISSRLAHRNPSAPQALA
jgi:hypothetical protein